MEWQPLFGQGLLIISASRSHSDATHSVGLLWTSDQPDAENSAYTKHDTHKRRTSMGFEPAVSADPRFRPLGHWDRLVFIITLANITSSVAGQIAIWLWWLFCLFCRSEMRPRLYKLRAIMDPFFVHSLTGECIWSICRMIMNRVIVSVCSEVCPNTTLFPTLMDCSC
jgi:hypothetical protein